MSTVQARRALLRSRHVQSDVYVGTREQLIAAALVRPDQFPGQPGRPKTRATYFVVDGEPAPHMAAQLEPSFAVSRISTLRFSVTRRPWDTEIERRRALQLASSELPLDLPGIAADHPAAPPDWTPLGWHFRGRRNNEFIFVVPEALLRDHPALGGQALPLPDSRGRCLSLRTHSARFGWVTVTHRSPRQYFMLLSAPSEIRHADYTADDRGSAIVHQGTKAQLRAHGLAVDPALPGEPGGPRGALLFTDRRTGRVQAIERLPRDQWCGEEPRYTLTEQRTNDELQRLHHQQHLADTERARRQVLERLPADPQAYRDSVAQLFWAGVTVTAAQMQLRLGYRCTREALREFLRAAEQIRQSLHQAPLTGRSPRESLAALDAQRARADEPLQRFLSELRPDKGA